MEIVLIGALSMFLYAGMSQKLSSLKITSAMWFAASGFIIYWLMIRDLNYSLRPGDYQGIKLIAEFTLILVLASDASRISLRSLKAVYTMPLRLLGIGLPLTIVLGAAIGLPIFPALPLAAVGLIAAILAPTDAALGAVIINNTVVPAKVRNSINIESGLNDGIALPVVLLFIYLLTLTNNRNWEVFLIDQLLIGGLVGVVVGWLGGWCLVKSSSLGWLSKSHEAIAALALAVIGYYLADFLMGNGFIAAFFTGLLYGNAHPRYANFMHEFTHTESSLLSHITFLLFGMLLLPEALFNTDYKPFLYGVLSLTIIRMLPVYVSLIGTKVDSFSRLFIGWFGPRGLASILYSLLLLDQLPLPIAHEVKNTVTIVVFMSIILHGITALPLSNLYAKVKEPS